MKLHHKAERVIVASSNRDWERAASMHAAYHGIIADSDATPFEDLPELARAAWLAAARTFRGKT